MTAILSTSNLRIALFFALISLHMTWLRSLETHVPSPYLDEIFHVPQAQAYWAGNWSHWDDKITTPPGLYLWSYMFNVVRRFLKQQDSSEILTLDELRFSNAFLISVLMVTISVWISVAKRQPFGETVLSKEYVMVVFPLLAFFSGLYYTDLFSAWTVVVTLVFWECRRIYTGLMRVMFQTLHVLFGLLSLASRQTNIFWVAVFLGGLQIVDTIQTSTAVNTLNNPEVGQAQLEDTFRFVCQLVPLAITHLPSLTLALWPQLILLVSFAAFVVWNGGVVLGDKSNHVATIHLPQMLYIWPCIIFFSWPVLLTQLSQPRSLLRRFPRPWLAALVLFAMAGAVHFNTIVHPFTLADNRHYVFYVFRILMRKWWIKYAAVPVYFVCAFLIISALSGGKRQPDGDDSTVRLNFLLIWVASTALSLITAPLVEPRYFIVPWIVWRLYVPENAGSGVDDHEIEQNKPSADSQESRIEQAIAVVAGYSLWIELAWYLLINNATCWMFLNKGFVWIRVPGKVQRFMW